MHYFASLAAQIKATPAQVHFVRAADLGVHEREGTLCLPRAKE
jgi:hypothetical protein